MTFIAQKIVVALIAVTLFAVYQFCAATPETE